MLHLLLMLSRIAVSDLGCKEHFESTLIRPGLRARTSGAGAFQTNSDFSLPALQIFILVSICLT